MVRIDGMRDVSTSTRRFAEKSTAQARSAFNKGGAAVAEGARHAEKRASTAVNGVRECYLKFLSMALTQGSILRVNSRAFRFRRRGPRLVCDKGARCKG
jgi:hypothetical protein